MQVSKDKELPLVLPDGCTPEVWLSQYDPQPHIIPEWPSSGKMALIVVRVYHYGLPNEGPSRGAVILKHEHLNEVFAMTDTTEDMVLFFTVPKGLLIREQVCPGLTLESW
jgi:hypothetical protein